MIVPAPRDKGDRGQWETVRYAIGSTARTIRFCVVVLILILGCFTCAAMMHLALHLLLPGEEHRTLTVRGSESNMAGPGQIWPGPCSYSQRTIPP